MVHVSRKEIAALALSALAVAASWRLLRWGMEQGDPRLASIRAIRNEALPNRDLVIVTDNAFELLDALTPIPALAAIPPLNDLQPFRRLYVLAPNEGSMGPLMARLGTPTATLGPGARRWDLDGLAVVKFDLNDHLLDRARARRIGGAHQGACVPDGQILRCQSPHDWNHLRVEPHHFNGVPIRCVFAHPQDNSELVIEVQDLPPGRALVGMVGMDDAAFHPTGAPVHNRIRFQPADGSPSRQVETVAPSKRGVTPYRLDLGGRAGSVSFTITTRNAGARMYCFTAVVTQ